MSISIIYRTWDLLTGRCAYIKRLAEGMGIVSGCGFY